jgi:CheY-like chemotaxis protein
VLLDLLMPERTFTVASGRSRPEWERLPILIVTAKDLAAEERQRLNGRIQALVAKGRLTPERLQEQLRRAGLRAGGWLVSE